MLKCKNTLIFGLLCASFVVLPISGFSDTTKSKSNAPNTSTMTENGSANQMSSEMKIDRCQSEPTSNLSTSEESILAWGGWHGGWGGRGWGGRGWGWGGGGWGGRGWYGHGWYRPYYYYPYYYNYYYPYRPYYYYYNW